MGGVLHQWSQIVEDGCVTTRGVTAALGPAANPVVAAQPDTRQAVSFCDWPVTSKHRIVVGLYQLPTCKLLCPLRGGVGMPSEEGAGEHRGLWSSLSFSAPSASCPI